MSRDLNRKTSASPGDTTFSPTGMQGQLRKPTPAVPGQVHGVRQSPHQQLLCLYRSDPCSAIFAPLRESILPDSNRHNPVCGELPYADQQGRALEIYKSAYEEAGTGPVASCLGRRRGAAHRVQGGPFTRRSGDGGLCQSISVGVGDHGEVRGIGRRMMC